MTWIKIGAAYERYHDKAENPVAFHSFRRLVTQGKIPSRIKGGRRELQPEAVDAFAESKNPVVEQPIDIALTQRDEKIEKLTPNTEGTEWRLVYDWGVFDIKYIEVYKGEVCIGWFFGPDMDGDLIGPPTGHVFAFLHAFLHSQDPEHFPFPMELSKFMRGCRINIEQGIIRVGKKEEIHATFFDLEHHNLVDIGTTTIVNFSGPLDTDSHEKKKPTDAKREQYAADFQRVLDDPPWQPAKVPEDMPATMTDLVQAFPANKAMSIGELRACLNVSKHACGNRVKRATHEKLIEWVKRASYRLTRTGVALKESLTPSPPDPLQSSEASPLAPQSGS